jgi:hypothetical protein
MWTSDAQSQGQSGAETWKRQLSAGLPLVVEIFGHELTHPLSEGVTPDGAALGRAGGLAPPCTAGACCLAAPCQPSPEQPARARSIAGSWLNQQRIHAPHISRRVFRHAAFGQQGLVKQDVGEVVEVD